MLFYIYPIVLALCAQFLLKFYSTRAASITICPRFRSHDNNTYVAAPGTVNGFGGAKKEGGAGMWGGAGGAAGAVRVNETELRPLRANEFEAAVPPPSPFVAASAK